MTDISTDRVLSSRAQARSALTLGRFIKTVGPGLIVMLADTDVGSIATAAQGGAQWGYRLVLPQLLFAIPLFLAQELAGRLGLAHGCGLAELVRKRYGLSAALILLAALLLSCFGALVTQMSGLAGIAAMWGVPAWQACCLAATILIVVVWTGTYRSVERVALAFGLFELAFVGLAISARPEARQILSQTLHPAWRDPGYLYLLAANLGTCVIPWAIFYQQSASVDKGLRLDALPSMRLETFAGAILCQIVTAAIGIAVAATFAHANGDSRSLSTYAEIARGMHAEPERPFALLAFVLGVGGAAFIASIVTALTAAWGFGEVFGLSRSVTNHPWEAPTFYVVLSLAIVGAAAIAASGRDLIGLAVASGIVNALLLPFVLVHLLLAARHLPAAHRYRPGMARVTTLTLMATAAIGIAAVSLGRP